MGFLAPAKKQHRIERWRAHSTVRGTFRIALAAGDGARHHRNCRDFLSARHVLIINQTITLVFAVVLSMLSLFISIQLHREEVVEDQEESQTLGVEFAAMAALGLFIALSMSLGIAATATLHLGHLGLFLFLIMTIIPALLLFALVLTDLNFVFRSYIQHHWTSKTLNVLRRHACERSWRHRCRAPIRVEGKNLSSVTEWCLVRFQKTDCESLRRQGVKRAWDLVRWTTAFLAAIAWTEAAMLVWCVRLVCIIVTVPIILDSAPRFYVYVLVPLAVACVFVGIDFRRHPAAKVEDDVRTIGNLFVATGVIMAVAVVVGRLAAFTRSAKLLLVFVFKVLVVLVLCAVIASFALISFFTLGTKLKTSTSREDIDELACDIDLFGCSGCQKDPPECKEWRISEIVKYAQAYVKFGGFLAIVSIPPWIAALYVAITLFISYRDYQSAYV
mmetsp:Transcript_7766/g.25489  ORF Transcript_7766/g.25489 Transcript_7766/m.25489 type:complete len:445 (-) Transcript_7766:200-1534(-)